MNEKTIDVIVAVALGLILCSLTLHGLDALFY